MVKIGDIILFKGTSPYSKLISIGNRIRYGTEGWTHAAIVAEVTDDTVVLYEALGVGFVRSPWGKKALLDRLRLKTAIRGESKYILKNVKTAADKYIGTPYGWLDIFQIGLYILFGKRSFILSTGSQQLICSEAVARILYDASDKNINFEKEFNKRYDLITPQDLRESNYITWE